MNLRRAGAVALVVATGTAGAGYAVRSAPPATALGPEPVTVVLDIDYSAFDPAALRVEVGTTVQFVVVNNDPINHELIVGPPEVHARHSDGTERRHRPKPGEVSVPPLSRAVTTYTFAEAGRVEFACHLPGHRDYGMRGQVEVIDPA